MMNFPDNYSIYLLNIATGSNSLSIFFMEGFCTVSKNLLVFGRSRKEMVNNEYLFTIIPAYM